MNGLTAPFSKESDDVKLVLALKFPLGTKLTPPAFTVHKFDCTLVLPEGSICTAEKTLLPAATSPWPPSGMLHTPLTTVAVPTRLWAVLSYR